MSGERDDHSLADEAAAAFVGLQQGEVSPEERAALEARLGNDEAYARAYIRAERMWLALDAHASSPELMRRREEAIAYVRAVSSERWLGRGRAWGNVRRFAMAGCALLMILSLGALWQLSPHGFRPGEYSTQIGEQRTVELSDHSRLVMDSSTRLHVRYTADARIVELLDGQAQFFVSKDLARPFKVKAGDQTIVALGTVFTVEFFARRVRVAMMEGRVAVVGSASSVAEAAPSLPIELSAGEEFRVNRAGRAIVIANADMDAATAWRDGKVIFRSEPLEEAVGRLNRYSRVRIEIDGAALAAEPISGVFEVGNAARFVDALQRTLPVVADQSEAGTIRLRLK